MVRVWDKNSEYIGDFEVPEQTPKIVLFGNKLYEYNKMYCTYVEVYYYTVPSLWTTKVKR